MGYDTPRKLGDRETGGGLSLPIWINYMETALKGVPVTTLTTPPGVVNVGGEWYYDEYTPGRAVSTLGVTASPAASSDPADGVAPGAPVPAPTPAPQERNRILDLFRN